jgi:hypothetical protein
MEAGFMLKDGSYAAWFRTPRGEGTGIVHFADGKVWGRDSILSYSGSYEVAGDRFSIILRTKRHTEGHPTVFGIDEFELRLQGMSNGAIATCSGTADLAPDIAFDAILISRQLQTSGSERPPPLRLNACRLPKLKRRLRASY